MKRTIYLAVITVITIGCVLYGVNGWYGGNGIDFSFGDHEKKYSIKESTTLEAFHSIVADAAIMDLSIVEGTEYSLDYKGTEKLELTYRMENGELLVTQRKKGNLTGINNATLILTVPMDTQLEKVNIKVDVGDIDITGADVNTLEVDSDVGDITVENVSLDNVILSSDTGDIDVDHCSFVMLDISSDVGDIEVNSSNDISSYSFDLKTDIGEVEVGTGEYGKKYYQEGKNGSIKAHGDVGDISINEF